MSLELALQRIFDSGDFTFAQNDLAEYGQDWTRFYTPNASAIVFPRNSEQIQELISLARSEKLGLVPSGGRTGMSGGACAINQEIVVSFEKMNAITAFDSYDATATVEPGVITANLQSYAMNKGLYYPVDFGSSGSSHIAGNIATNAGGI
ncbi:MAG: FAD-binding oxidoreductase, partial [Pseudomonadales bacterium]|nr:FAD-binding oxidoreductase [Pseudomonadales bacterium]